MEGNTEYEPQNTNKNEKECQQFRVHRFSAKSGNRIEGLYSVADTRMSVLEIASIFALHVICNITDHNGTTGSD